MKERSFILTLPHQPMIHIMNKRILPLIILMGFAMFVRPLAAAEPGVAGSGCDRSCLYGIADEYFAALEAHDPSRAPAIRLVKFTENGVRMPLGDGLWNTFS